MITLSDASSFADDPVSVRKFKPWWEIASDYLVLGLLMCSLLSWTRVISMEASGLVCIPQNPAPNYPTAEARYVNSRCSQEFHAKFLLYYPYVLFFQWVVLFLCQKLWLKLPSVVTKLDTFHDIFSEMGGVTPMFLPDSQNLRMLPQLTYDEENQEKIRVLHDKLMFLLTERSYVALLYRIKVNSMILLVIVSAAGMGLWLGQVQFMLADFACNLPMLSNSTRAYRGMVCNFSPAVFLFGVVLFHFGILVIILGLCCWVNRWLANIRLFMDKHDVFGDCKDYYKGLPGCSDLQFCLALLRSNLRDGCLLLEIIRSCIKGQNAQMALGERGGSSGNSNRSRPEASEASFKSLSIRDEYDVVKYIQSHLGLDEVPSRRHSDHLFECLEFIKQKVRSLDFDIVTSIRDRVRQEICNNPLQYKPIIDNDPSAPNYLAYVRRLEDPSFHGDSYAIMAAANILTVRIVVITCGLSAAPRSIFEPYSTGVPTATYFLTFLSPQYYHATRVVSCSADQEHRRGAFIVDAAFRARLRQEAVRHVTTHKAAAEDLADHEETINSHHTWHALMVPPGVSARSAVAPLVTNAMGRKRDKSSSQPRRSNSLMNDCAIELGCGDNNHGNDIDVDLDLLSSGKAPLLVKHSKRKPSL